MASPINAIVSDAYASLIQEALSGSSGDTTPVFIYPPSYPLQHGIVREFIENDLGDGYGQTISSEFPYERADGIGGVASHYGLNVFSIRFPRTLKGTGNLAYNLWEFIRTRLENDNEAFYFYNPSETLTPDPNGLNPIGRYLVRCANPNQVLQRSYYAYTLFDFGAIELVEDRNASSLVRVAKVMVVSDNMGLHYNDSLDSNFKVVSVSDSFISTLRESVGYSLNAQPIVGANLLEAFNWNNLEDVKMVAPVPKTASDDYGTEMSDDVAISVTTP